MRTANTRIAVLALILLGLAVAANAQMQTYTSTEGRFSVQFPGTAEAGSQALNLKGGETIPQYMFSVSADNDSTAYMVLYNDYPPGYANGAPQSVLQNVRDGATSDKTLLSDTAIELQGVPGRAFTAEDSKWSYSIQVYLMGKRLYQLIVVTTKGRSAPYANQFFDSFRIR